MRKLEKSRETALARLRQSHAIFGGTFDPPHLGHLAIITELKEEHRFKNIWIVPTGMTSYKGIQTSPQNRLEMAQLCFTANAVGKISSHLTPTQADGIDIIDYEIEFSASTHQICSSLQTLKYLKQKLGVELCFVMGSDQLNHWESWYQFPEVAKLCNWIVLERKGELAAIAACQRLQNSGLLRKIDDNGLFSIEGSPYVLFVTQTHAPEASSSKIRAEIELFGPKALETEGKSAKAYLPDSIKAYLMTNPLYGTAHSNKTSGDTN